MAKKTTTKTTKRKASKAAARPTYRLQSFSRITLEGVEGASFNEAANAVLLDFQRRLRAGELTSLDIQAHDKSGNTISAEL